MKSLTLKIAGLDLRLELSENKWHEYCQKKYANFVIDKLSASGLTIQVIFIKSTRAKDIKFRYLSNKKTKIFFPNSIRHFQYFNFAIKNIFAGMLLLKRSGMIHASSVKIGKGGILFVGKSGAGKSTAAKLSRQTILADDRSVFRIFADNIYIYSSPFYEANPFLKTRSKCLLRAIFLLERKVGQKIKVGQLSKQESLFRLLPHIVIREESPPTERKKQLRSTFKVCQEIVSRIPVYSLSYDAKEKGILYQWLRRYQG